MKSMRAGALDKYGASNHLNINWRENLDRASRHILALVGYRSDLGGTATNEMSHVWFRL